LREILVLTFLAIGTFFLLLGSWGLLRLPDVLCRMHATTKSTTFGACGLLLALAMDAGWSEAGFKSLLAVVFLLLTAPVGAHMIARAAYRGRVPLAGQTTIDELKPVYETLGFWSEGRRGPTEVVYRSEDLQ
jgi:multicomponent Na+:H+ antiporter subunit G